VRLPLIQGTQARIRDRINLPPETTSEDGLAGAACSSHSRRPRSVEWHAPAVRKDASRLQNKLRDFILRQSNQRQGGKLR
jgi:hypothetical protein